MARSRSNSSDSRLVYSTETGVRPAAKSGKSERKARRGKNPDPKAPQAPADDLVRVWRQTKGRKGKGVTVVTGLRLPAEELSKIAGELKKRCGSGGTAKAGVVEIQGDHRDTVVDDLRRRGFKVKLAGG